MAVNLSPVGGAAAQFFDNNGIPLAGGLLYTYAAGTSTPLATYTTQQATVLNSNPIVLDSAGRVPNEIWLTSTYAYKFVLQNASGVQVWSYDNLVGINSNFTAYSLQEQTFTATQGQTVFTLTGISYVPGTNNLSVFVNGSKQIVSTNYLETSSTVVTFLTGLNVGDVVDFITAISTSTTATTANNISYTQGSTGSTTTNVQAKLQQTIALTDFSTVAQAITTGGSLYVPAGTYNITSNTDFGTCSLTFAEGALFNVTDGINVYIRNQVQAGNYQIFSTTGNVICAGANNPMWWGAVTSITSPSPAVAAANTLAFRKCAKSFYADYVVNNGSSASPSGPQINFWVQIPSGAFYLSNGFSAANGVPVRGTGSNTLLCRLTANADTDTAIPLLTIGQTLSAAPTLSYVSPSTACSPMTGTGFSGQSAQAYDLYFVDQNASVAAFRPYFSGLQFSNLFFTACGISIDLTGAGDCVGSDIIIDQGLTGIVFGDNCQNINLTNIEFYLCNYSMSFGTNINSIQVSNMIVEYPQYAGILMSGGGNIDNVTISNSTFLMNAQFSTFTGAVRIRSSNVNMFFKSCTFRNLYGPAINNDLAQANNRFTFQDCNFDANRTSASYTQGSTMSVISALQGDYIFSNCQFKNMYSQSSITYGPVNLYVNGLIMKGSNLGATPQFGFPSGSGLVAYFIGNIGTGAGSLYSTGVATVNISSNFNI